MFPRETGENDLKRDAIVFAPHPDDETLGCGGTIARKKEAGARVVLVFMTDGRCSHGDSMSGEELKTIRMNEALAATRTLTGKETDATFLGFEDETLAENQDAAVAAVTRILRDVRPEEIFIPHRREAPADHRATTAIVLTALRNLSALRHSENGVTVYEYPIWLWRHWPWTGMSTRSRRKKLRFAANSLVAVFHFLWDLRCAVRIADVLHVKRAALNQHRSQMTRLVPGTDWPTLADVSDGEFLECFFREHELFRRYVVPKPRRRRRPARVLSRSAVSG